MGKYKKSHSRTKGAATSSAPTDSAGSSPEGTPQRKGNEPEDKDKQQNGIHGEHLPNGNSNEQVPTPTEDVVTEDTSEQPPANGEVVSKPQKPGTKEVVLKKRLHAVREQNRELQEEIAVLKATLEEERERSELAEQGRAGLELWATGATALAVLSLTVAAFSFSRTHAH